ncbi:uncharacterized protein isoform X1 [Leptinotarsa decemlineata]|uniref:uncharacterized protein isoform X1 n=1 Tax=Leptinotarsa decemlineata TaxID=7539 RepID=UPI003D306B45
MKIVGDVIIILAAIIACEGGKTRQISPENEKYLMKVFASVDSADRKAALIHQLYLGYITKNPKRPNFEVPIEDTLKIYDIIMNNFKFPDPKLNSIICFPSGECVDPDDSGVYPPM